MILIVVVFALKNDVQTDVPVTNIYITFVCLDTFAGGKKDDAGMLTKVLVAILDELCPGGLGIIIEGKIDVVDQTRGSLFVDDQLICTAGQSQYCY